MGLREWSEEERHAAGVRLAEGRRRRALELNPPAEVPAIMPPPMAERPPQSKRLVWADLPTDARKAAKRSGKSDNAPVHQMRCIRCRLPMWTRDEKLEDICERCEYIMINEKHEALQKYQKSQGGRMVNPLRDSDEVTQQVNPLSGPIRIL